MPLPLPGRHFTPQRPAQLRCVKPLLEKFRRENGLDYSPEDIVVANGAKQIIFNALMATLRDGDEAILPAPYFVSYPEMVKLLGGVPVVVECRAEAGFRLTPEVLEGSDHPADQVAVPQHAGQSIGRSLFRSPIEDARRGAGAPPAGYGAVGRDLRAYPLRRAKFVSFGKACPELRDRSLIVNGVSKAYAMTGWRVGYAAGPAPLIKAMSIVQSQSCTSVCSLAQAAALAALTGPQDCVAEFRAAFERRRDLVVAGIAQIAGLTLDAPAGAFYAYIGCADPDRHAHARWHGSGGRLGSREYLLSEGRVAAVPGAAYGLSPFFRISTATSDVMLSDAAIARIGAAVVKLQPGQVAA